MLCNYSMEYITSIVPETVAALGTEEGDTWNARNPRPDERRDGRWLVGMGMAAARRLSQRHRVLVADLDEARARSAAEALCAEGGDAVSFACDITERIEVTMIVGTELVAQAHATD